MSNHAQTIEELFPDLTPEQMKSAEENLDGYLVLVLRILERTKTHPQPDPLTENNGTLRSSTFDSYSTS